MLLTVPSGGKNMYIQMNHEKNFSKTLMTNKILI